MNPPRCHTRQSYLITLDSYLARRIESNCNYQATKADRPEDVISLLVEVGFRVLERTALDEVLEETRFMVTQLKRAAVSRHETATDTPRVGHATRPYCKPFGQIGNPLFERALWWLSFGVDLVPVQPGRKAIVNGFGPYQKRITSLAEARPWFETRQCNLAVVCGSGPGLVAIDFDDPAAFSSWLADHDIQTLVETSCQAGRGHVFVFDPGAVNATVANCEVRARDRVVTVAPSLVEGARYGILRNCEILRADVDELFPYLAPSSNNAKPQVTARAQTFDRRDSLIAKIKQARTILAYASSLLSERHFGLRSSDGGRGRWWSGRCPFHDDKRPSFWVDSERGLFGCHASGCPASRGGDVINLHALACRLSVKDAVADLARELKL